MADDGVWRDEKKLPLSDLAQAMGVSSQDGQVDDVTGNDAGMEQAYGEQLRGTPEEGSGDPDPTSAEGRRARPSFDGPLGPH